MRRERSVVVGLVVLPLAIAGILTWALSAPTQHLDRVTAAIVNDDVPVTLNGKTVPVGREFAAGLMGSDEGFDWVLTNDADAVAGLTSGAYVAVVTIPSSFSELATSFSGAAQSAHQADVRVETAPTSALLDPALTQAVTDAAVDALNHQLTAQYVEQLLTGYTTIDAQIAQAATGATDLATGAASLADGANQLAAGAQQLDAGVQALDGGAAALSDGAGTLAASAQDLPGQTAQLATGSAGVASATDSAAAGLAAATARVAAVVATVCPSPGPECTGAQDALTALQQASADVADLAAVADKVAAGNASLAAAMPELVDGIDGVAGGAADVATGADQASAGASALVTGSQSVATGAAQLQAGADQLADGLDQAVAQIPTYSSDDVGILSTVAAQPVRADQVRPEPGMQAVPLFAVVALWIGGLVLAYVRPILPSRAVLLTAERSTALASRALLPGALVGVVQGVVVGVAVLFAVHVDAGAWFGFVVASALVGFVFAVVNQGLAAALGGVGRFVAVLVAVVALVVGLSSTVPPSLDALAALLPTTPALGLLLSALTGDTGTAWVDALALAVFAVLGALLVLLAVVSRRRVPQARAATRSA